MRSLPLLAAGLASLALAAPAAAADPLPTTSFFFTCQGPTKVQNAEAKGWSTTAPATSFTAGAGCGSVDPSVAKNRAGGVDADFLTNGTYTGTIQSINVEVHSLLLSQARALPDFPGEFELTIDGEQVVFDNTTRIAGQVSSTGVSEKFVFSFSRAKPAGATEAPPLAGPGAHTIAVRFGSRTVEYNHLWVWGASEVPAGLTVNPAKLSAPKILG